VCVCVCVCVRDTEIEREREREREGAVRPRASYAPSKLTLSCVFFSGGGSPLAALTATIALLTASQTACRDDKGRAAVVLGAGTVVPTAPAELLRTHAAEALRTLGAVGEGATCGGACLEELPLEEAQCVPAEPPP
jgi:hypothetical protein